MLTFGSLFSGIGGIDLGLERAGWQCAWQVEIDDYARAVLEKHWPHVARYRDVRFFLGSKRWRRARVAWYVDCIAGGFPCQDISVAGRGEGIDGKRSGLWNEFARIVRLLRPRYVLVENVPALTVRGFGRVLGDLAALGFDAEWGCLPAAAVAAPHTRWRLFIVGYRRQGDVEVRGRRNADGHEHEIRASARQEVGATAANDVAPSYANSSRQPQSQGSIQEQRGRTGFVSVQTPSDAASRWAGQRWGQEFAAYCERTRNLFWPPVEPGIRGVAAGIPHRVDRLRGLGNAVVPQIAEWIGRRVLESHYGTE